MSVGLEIRDPIHGFIYRDPHEQKITDTRVFQRLRRIKQLALATLVYPGAVHTRFGHSLGTFHIASRLADRFLASQTERRLVRLAALLHDIGHGPFSHVSEEILKRFAIRDRLRLSPGQQVHEALTQQIIMSDPELGRVLGPDELEQIVGLLSGQWGESILKGIISGPLDADKQDYLLRDSYFCGVKYGVFDIDRLTENLHVHDDGDDKVLALSPDGIHVLEQFVLAKYYMTTQVYRHRVRLISDEMIIRGISLGISEDNIDWLKHLYSYDGSRESLTEYLAWHDERLVTRILEPGTCDGYAKRLFLRLAERKLFKMVFSGRPTLFEEPEIRERVFAGESKLLDAIEKKVAERFHFEPKLVFAKLVKVPSVRAQAASTEGQIIVLNQGGPRFFHEESTLFKSIDEAIQEQALEIYAPVEYKDEKKKKAQRREFKSEITEIIKELAHPQQRLYDTKQTGGGAT